MTRSEIIEKLENEEYVIKHAEDCDCSFCWGCNDGTLDDGADGPECWESNVLYIGDEIIAEYIRYEGLKIHTRKITRDDLDDEIVDDLRMSDHIEQGESSHCDTHEERRRETLIEYLMEPGRIVERDDCRGFANEYVISIETDPESPEVMSREDAEEWADQILYIGDAATQTFVTVNC